MHLRLVAILLLVLLPTITTLKCYVCNENEHPSCADESVLAKFATECQEKTDPYCRKITQTVNGKNTIVRTCGSKTGAKACYKTAGKNNANVCSCNTDLCNSAVSLRGVSQFAMSIISSMIVLSTTMIFLR